jgi:hypothetical protein
LNIGSDAPIVGVCIAGLAEPGVGETAKTVAPAPRRVDLNSKTRTGTNFPLGRGAATIPRLVTESGAKISDQPYRFLNINPLFTIYAE